MKHARAAAIVCAVVLMMSLLLAHAHPFGDAGLYASASSPTPIAENNAVPADVRAVLVAKCADCHSMETRNPAYDRVAIRLAPASWLIERDIVQARRAMNLDAWGSYSADQQQAFTAKMVKETKSHEMPPAQYIMIHRDAQITDADVRMFEQWAHSMQEVEVQPVVVKSAVVRNVPVAMVHVESPAVDDAGDAVRGKDVFERRCTGCHAVNEDHEGPRLQGVYGRAAGAVVGFAYSAALKQAHVTWDDATLEQWLADPDTLVPGNDMDFHVAKAQERKDLIEYLKQISGK